MFGDATGVAASGDTYVIESLRLGSGSGAEDVGAVSATAVPGDDIEGDLRPGVDGLVDIGSDEIGLWIDIEGPITVLRNQNVSFSASAGGGVAPYAYTWRWQDGTPDGSGASTAHTFVISGLFIVELEVADATPSAGTAYRAVSVVPLEVSPAGGLPLLLAEVGGALRVAWEDPADPGALFNVYSGTPAGLGGTYDHTPLLCHVPGTVGTGPWTGYRYVDVPFPPGNAYVLVTASSQGGEGTAGLSSGGASRDVTTGGTCGASP